MKREIKNIILRAVVVFIVSLSALRLFSKFLPSNLPVFITALGIAVGVAIIQLIGYHTKS